MKFLYQIFTLNSNILFYFKKIVCTKRFLISITKYVIFYNISRTNITTIKIMLKFYLIKNLDI